MKSSLHDLTIDQTDATFSRKDHLTSEESLRNIRQPELSPLDHLEIKRKLKKCKENIKSSLSENEVANEGVIFPLISCILLILLITFISRVSIIGNLSNSIVAVFEEQEWQSSPEKFLADIQDLDELNVYIENILLYNGFKTYYLRSFNYVCGLRMTLKLAHMIPNPYSFYNVISYIKQDTSYSATSQNSGEETQRQGLWNYTVKNSFQSDGGYTNSIVEVYLQDALREWRIMKPIWLDKDTFVSLSTEMIIHNTNLYSTLYYYQIFELDNSGKLQIQTGTTGISPEMYMAQNEEFVIIIVILSIYLIVFLIQFWKCARNLWKAIDEIIKKGNNPMTWYDYLEIIVIALIIAILALFLYTDIGNIGKFSLPLDSETFNGMINYAVTFRSLLRLASITCIFIVLRLVASLKTQFPSFGVLFDTIKHSSSDLLNIGFITMILLTGFTLQFYIAFGSHVGSYSTVGSAALELFSTLIGIIDLRVEFPVGNDLKNFMLIFYILLFNFVLIKMLGAIIMSTYLFLKNRDQLLLAARAEMLKDKSIALFKLLVNLLIFRTHDEIYKNAELYQKLMKEVGTKNNEDQSDIKDKIKLLKNSIVQQSNVSIFTIFKSNLATLNAFLTSSVLENRAIVINRLKEKIKFILVREKIADLKTEKRELDVEFNFGLITELFVFILLLILFSYTVLSQFSISENYELQELNKNSVYLPSFISEKTLTLSAIQSFDEIYDFFWQVIIPLSVAFPYESNYLFVNNSIRSTLQRFSTGPNESAFSKNRIQNVLLDSYNTSDFRGSTTELQYLYIEPGRFKTYKNQGGYSWTFQNYQQGGIQAYLAKTDSILGYDTAYFAIEWVTYNSNFDCYSYNSLVFSQDPSGMVNNKFSSVAINPQVFSTGNTGQILLSIFTLIICFWFTGKSLNILKRKWIKYNKLRIKKGAKINRLRKIVEGICNEGKPKERISCIKCVYLCSLKIFRFVTVHTILIGMVLYKYYTKNISRSIDTVSTMLIYTCMVNSIRFKFNVLDITSFDSFSAAADLVSYSLTLSAFALFFLYIRLPTYFFLSPRMAFLMGIMKKARLDFLFFLLMFFSILMGFVIAGFILLGHSHPGYLGLTNSFLSNYLIRFRMFNTDQYSKADPILGVPYLVILVIVMVFFLFSMFMAITTGYYKTLSKNYNGKFGLIEKIILTIKAKYRNEVVIQPREDIVEETYINNEDMQDEKETYEHYSENLKREIVNPWLKETEDLLKLKTKSELVLAKLRLPYMAECHLNSSHMIDIVFMPLEQWIAECSTRKAELWDDICFYNYQFSLLNKNVLAEDDEHILNSEYVQKLWDLTTQEEKLEIWMSNLSHIGRIYIWNMIPYENNLKENWPNYPPQEKWKAVQAFIQLIVKHNKAFKKAKKPLEYAEKLSVSNKAKFWLCLTGKTEQKVEIFINNSDSVESEIICYMIISDTIQRVIQMEGYDETLERYLDHAFYSFVEAKTWLQVEMKKLKDIHEKKNSTLSECQMLADYKMHLQSERLRLKNIVERLKQNKD